MRNAITLALVFMFSLLFGSNVSSQTVRASSLCMMQTGPIYVSLRSEPTAPYSATRESSTVQTTHSDGMHITMKPQTSKIYRDSQGRTRDEVFCGPASDNQRAIVTIRDPVAGVGYLLEMRNRIAHRFAGENDGKPSTASGISSTTSGNSSSGSGAVTATVTDHPSAKIEPIKQSSEPLGTQTIEGLAAEGTRTTYTIPADTQKNGKELRIVTETWHSSELKTMILRKSLDPRFGEMTWRLIDINLAEPDPSLFKVPAGFKIVDESGPITVDY
jgi:hypothetical protein